MRSKLIVVMSIILLGCMVAFFTVYKAKYKPTDLGNAVIGSGTTITFIETKPKK